MKCVRRIIDGIVYYDCGNCNFRSPKMDTMHAHFQVHFNQDHFNQVHFNRAQLTLPELHAQVQTLKKRRVVGWCHKCATSFTNKLIAKGHKKKCPARARRVTAVRRPASAAPPVAADDDDNPELSPDGLPLLHILELAEQTQMGLPELPQTDLPELPQNPNTLQLTWAICAQLLRSLQ